MGPDLSEKAAGRRDAFPGSGNVGVLTAWLREAPDLRVFTISECGVCMSGPVHGGRDCASGAGCLRSGLARSGSGRPPVGGPGREIQVERKGRMTRTNRYLKARQRAFTVGLVLAAMAVPRAACGQWTAGSGGTIYYNNGNVGIGTTDPNTLVSHR